MGDEWALQLPSLDVKPRLKVQVFDYTSLGLGSDQLYSLADIKLLALYDELVTLQQPIINENQCTTGGKDCSVILHWSNKCT